MNIHNHVFFLLLLSFVFAAKPGGGKPGGGKPGGGKPGGIVITDGNAHCVCRHYSAEGAVFGLATRLCCLYVAGQIQAEPPTCLVGFNTSYALTAVPNYTGCCAKTIGSRFGECTYTSSWGPHKMTEVTNEKVDEEIGKAQ